MTRTANGERQGAWTIIAVCAHCKRVRDDQGCWKDTPAPAAAPAGAHFSHGICPICGPVLYPDFFDGSDDEESAPDHR